MGTVHGHSCKDAKRKRPRKTIKVKSGMCSKRRTLNASVISIKGCPIKATVMSTSDHQSQTFHSSNQPLNSRLLRKLPLLLPRSSHQSFRQHPAPSQPLPVPLNSCHTSAEADYTRRPKAYLASDHSRRRRRQSAGAAKSKIPELLLLRQFQHTS
jgi:hypothetical protein